MNQRRTYLLPFGVALALLITLVATMTRNVPVAQAAGNVTLSVAHFAPFADTVNDTSVTVRVNGGDLITEFVFAEVESSIVVPAGVYTIEVIPSGSVTPAMTSAPTELMADTEYFIAAVGGANGYDLALYPLVINKTPAPTSAKLRVSHLAPFATPSSATAVDICTDTNTPVIEGLTYLSSTAYLELAPATYDLKIAVSGSDCATVALDLAPFTLRAGQIVDVFARGLLPSGDSFDAGLGLGVYVKGPANVAVAHFAPFAEMLDGTSVTVRVDGTEVLTDFTFSSVTPYLSLPNGERFVEIIPTGASEAAISGTLDVQPLVNYFVAAVGGANGFDLGLYPLVVETNALTASAKLRVSHLAPFATPSSATAVDICTDTNTPVIEGLTYLSSTAYLPLPPAVYDLKIAVAGSDCATVALNLAPFTLRAGQIVDVFARGLLPTGAASVAQLDPELELGVYVMGPGNVSVAHFAPFADSVAGTAVTVRVDGADLLTNFTFPSITPYVSLPMGDHYVEIIPAGGSDPVITGTLAVSPLVDYTVAAIGFITDDVDLGLGLKVFVDDNATTPPAGSARVRAAHLAPFADSLTGTQVDLCTTPGGTPVLDNVPYKASATLDLPQGILPTYLSGPTPDCGPAVFTLPVVSLGDGDIVYLYVVGGRNGLPLQIATPGVDVAEANYLPSLFYNEP